MSRPQLPRNVQPIIQARQIGLRPQGPVLVSFVGDVPWDAPTVYADSGVTYQWGWAKGLDLYVVVRPGVDAMDAICKLSALCSGSYLGVIDIERHAVSFVLGIDPVKLWPRKRVNDFFPEEVAT